MKRLGIIAIALVMTAIAVMWWREGGPSWYGVAVMSLFATKMILSGTAKDAKVTTPEQQAIIDDLVVGVAIPAYNEDPDLLAGCLQSLFDQTRPVQSIVVIDDFSSDPRAAAEADTWVPRFAERGITMQVIRFPENRGKREGLVASYDAMPGIDILLGVDSDTVLALDAIEKGIVPMADPEVMVATGLVLPINYRKNLLTRLTEVRYANAFLFERGAYSKLGSVLCACGSLAFYRASVMGKNRDDFLNQMFLGKPAVFGDDRRMTNYALMEGKSVFQSQAVAYTAVPERMGHYIRQQVRWNKSFFRESLWALANLPVTTPAFWLTAMEISTWAIFTVMLTISVVVAPVATGSLLIGPFLIYAALLAYARSFRYFEVAKLRESRRDIVIGFAISPLYAVMHIFLLVWLRLYALATLTSGSWGTRADGVEVSVEAEAVPRALAMAA